MSRWGSLLTPLGFPFVLGTVDTGLIALIGTILTALVTVYTATSSRRATSAQHKETLQDKLTNTAMEAAKTSLEAMHREVEEMRTELAQEREQFGTDRKQFEERLMAANTEIRRVTSLLEATNDALRESAASEVALTQEVSALRAELADARRQGVSSSDESESGEPG